MSPFADNRRRGSISSRRVGRHDAKARITNWVRDRWLAGSLVYDLEAVSNASSSRTLEFPAANLGPAMKSLVRETRPTTFCLVGSDSNRRSQRPSRRLSTRRRPRGLGSPVWGNNGTARLQRRLLARLSNSCDVLNLRPAGPGASHQGLFAATCRQSFSPARQFWHFEVTQYTAASLVWNLRDPTGVLDEAPLENGDGSCHE